MSRLGKPLYTLKRILTASPDGNYAGFAEGPRKQAQRLRPPPYQGDGHGFESRLPLHIPVQVKPHAILPIILIAGLLNAYGVPTKYNYANA